MDELQEHMRIELLDPRWKSQRDVLEARKAQASELQRGANVVSSLKNLARTRVDIFGAEEDEEKRKREEEEERIRRREREKVVWDGHTASKANTLDKFSSNVNFDEQIAAIHRAKGLGPYVHLPPSSFNVYCTYNSFTEKQQVQSVPELAQQQPQHLSLPFQQPQLPYLHHQPTPVSHPIPHSTRPPFPLVLNQRPCTLPPLLLSCSRLSIIKVWMPPNHLATSHLLWGHQ